MHALLSKPLDWIAIRTACRAVRQGGPSAPGTEEAERLLAGEDFPGDGTGVVEDLTFFNEREFVFSSPVETPWPENNRVYGRLFAGARRWQDQPVVLLLHGWDGEAGYRWQFPLLAARLNALGCTAVGIELPFHARRKPGERGAKRNLLSADLAGTVLGLRQTIADARSILHWIRWQGCPAIGTWGCSLGGWLSGLLSCVHPGLACSVLWTPAARIDRLLDEVAFCRPLRRSLGGRRVDVSRLNLKQHVPRSADDVLIVAGQHDLITPPDTLEELHACWAGSEIWRVPHGHISSLMAVPLLDRGMRWMAGRLGATARAGRMAEG